jgi:N utilization substance protein A
MYTELQRIVDAIRRDETVDKEVVFRGIERALTVVAEQQFGGEGACEIHIDRGNGAITAARSGIPIDADSIGRVASQLTLGRIKSCIREAERERDARPPDGGT